MEKMCDEKIENFIKKEDIDLYCIVPYRFSEILKGSEEEPQDINYYRSENKTQTKNRYINRYIKKFPL